ncbi:MAG: type II secretion system GspH family protein [Lentisphaeraceae bacterium]|nr:type II secretion system GspH family protein [Lentisphaeraceae bacterium]
MKKFTLLELMVVIAIIGILITMLIPSLTKARKAAESAVCLSNIKQTATAMIVYSQENNHFAPKHASHTGNGPRISWIERLYPEHLTNYLLTHCPSGSNAPDWYNESTLLWSDIGANQRLVGTNYIGANGGAGHAQEASFLTAKSPAKTSLLMDSAGGYMTLTNWHFRYETGFLYGDAKEEKKYIGRHLKRGNVLYMDLHATGLNHAKLNTLASGYSATFWDPNK